jgi:hypothetical protein
MSVIWHSFAKYNELGMEQTRKSTEFCEKISWKTEDKDEQLSDGSYARMTLDLRMSATPSSALIQVFLFTLSLLCYNSGLENREYGSGDPLR